MVCRMQRSKSKGFLLVAIYRWKNRVIIEFQWWLINLTSFYSQFKFLWFTNNEYVLQIDLLEPKMISSSNVNYLSLTKHHLFHLESFMPMGQLHLLMQLDEYKLRPKKFFFQFFNFFRNPFLFFTFFQDISCC